MKPFFYYKPPKTTLKIHKGLSEAVIRRKTINTTPNRKRTKDNAWSTKYGDELGAPEEKAILVPQEAPVVLLFLKIR
jgi:hypothetical protein